MVTIYCMVGWRAAEWCLWPRFICGKISFIFRGTRPDMQRQEEEEEKKQQAMRVHSFTNAARDKTRITCEINQD
jgi:hypothetical protein